MENCLKTYSSAYNDQIHTPGIVILYESSGKAGGLPKGELSDQKPIWYFSMIALS
jgi:hypothetical protein